MNQILEQLGTYGIVPVVVLQDAAKAEPLAEALCKGGLACAEVTFRTDAAEESIRIMSEKFPEMLVGAGTVLTTEQADRKEQNILKCPTCDSTNIRKMGGVEHGASIAAFGIFSKKINKTFKCGNCGYTW